MGRERRMPSLNEAEDAAPGQFGCPMLVRGHDPRGFGHGPIRRCSLGWSIHNLDEADRCYAVTTLTDCWKAKEDHGALHEAPVFLSRVPKRRAKGSSVAESDADQGEIHGPPLMTSDDPTRTPIVAEEDARRTRPVRSRTRPKRSEPFADAAED